jgi:hypothetical protein
LGVFGILLIFIAVVVENHGHGLNAEILILFVKEMGILLFAIVTTSLVHDRFLRSHSLREMEHTLQKQFLGDSFTVAITAVIEKVIKGQLPENYMNIKESGLADAFTDLQVDKVAEKISKLDEKSEVFILQIWLTGIDRLLPAIGTAVRKGCKFRIILLHPDSIEVFKKRGRSLQSASMDSDTMKAYVIESIKRLTWLKDTLSENDRRNLELRLHEDFVSASICGFDHEVLVGFYLHDNLAENNIQLKITGKHSLFYEAFKSHFNSQWESTTNVDLAEYYKSRNQVGVQVRVD